MHTRNSNNKWYFIFSFLFLVLVGACSGILFSLNRFPETFSFVAFFLIVLATFRLIRLVVYDQVFSFVRDYFISTGEICTGGICATISGQGGLKTTISELMHCPWCAGMFLSLLAAFFYFLTPYTHFFFYILAVAALASLMQLFANLVGWHAEYKKIETKKFGSK